MSRQTGDELNNAARTGVKGAKAVKKGVKGGVKAAKGIKRMLIFLITNPIALIAIGIILIIMLGGLWIEQTITPGTDSNLYLTSIGDEDRIPEEDKRGETIESMDPAKDKITKLLQIIADERFHQLEKAYDYIRKIAQRTLTDEGVALTMSSIQDLTQGGIGITNFIEDAGNAGVLNNSIAGTALGLAWPNGTNNSKYDFYTGSPTDAYEKAYEELTKHGTDKSNMSDCGYFVETVVKESGVDEKFKALSWDGSSFKYHDDCFNNVKNKVIVNGKISSNNLKAGDIIQYKKDDGSQHILIFINGNLIAEAVRGIRFPVVMSIDMNNDRFNSSNTRTETIEVLRAKKKDAEKKDKEQSAPITYADLDILSIYSVSIGNTGLKSSSGQGADDEDDRGGGDGTLDTSYTDMKGNAIPIYRFGEKKGQIKYEKDLKKKFSMLNPDKVQFYDIKMQDAIATLYDASGNPYKVKYYQSTITDRDIAEISKDTFAVDLDKEYPNASFGGSITTNLQAVTTFSETTQKTLFAEGFNGSDASFIMVDGKYKNPVGNASYVVTSDFNVIGDVSYHMDHHHAGIDLGIPVGTKIIAAADGTIVRAEYFGGYGNCVDLKVGKYLFRYGHLSKFLCAKGQTVSAGQVIALSGNTGNSTGPHLHFEVQENGTAVNPRKFVKFK